MARARVLVVDDSKFVRTTFRRILQDSFDVREEADGEAGWNAIATDARVSCVFCDITMPHLDGFGVLERVRGSADERIRQLPVVIISGDEDEATRRRAKASGANDFISKTAEATEVLARIESLVRALQARQEAAEVRRASTQAATHDPQTGAFTLHYLLTEGRKHFSQARRHGDPLAVICFRIDNYAGIAAQAGREFAVQLAGRVARGVQGALRAEDTLARVGEGAFAVMMARTAAAQAAAFARRLHEQLAAARFQSGARTLRIEPGIGIAALDADRASAVEDLLRLATERMTRKATLAAPAPTQLPPEVERALQVLERTPPERLGKALPEVLRRLRPFLVALQKTGKRA